MYRAIAVERKSRVIHDFPYNAPQRRCPHAAIVNIAKSGHCVFDCKYCYAKGYPWSTYTDVIEVYKNTPALLDAELNAIKICPPLYFCAVTDPFQPIPLVYKTALAAMDVAARHGVYFTIITKSDLVLKILERKWARHGRCRVSITCESINFEKIKAVSGAQAPSKRLAAAGTLIDADLDVRVRVDPLIAGFTDDYDELAQLFEMLNSIGIQHVTVSTGAFNPATLVKLLAAISDGGFKESATAVKQKYVIDNGKYVLNVRDRLHLYQELSSLCRRFRLSASFCMETLNYVPLELTRCRTLGKLAVKEHGIFTPVCDADCINACPQKSNPPCNNRRMLTEYPYKWGMLIHCTR
ncbi:MAG: radical SAM protein [Halobacteriota archaeon]